MSDRPSQIIHGIVMQSEGVVHVISPNSTWWNPCRWVIDVLSSLAKDTKDGNDAQGGRNPTTSGAARGIRWIQAARSGRQSIIEPLAWQTVRWCQVTAAIGMPFSMDRS
jgi:hypothetical protein